MALQSFQIRDEGGLDFVDCDDVPQLMVIAGPNGVGKSTLLNALYKADQSSESRYRNNGLTPDIDVDFDSETEDRCVFFSPNRVPRTTQILRQHLIDSGSNRFVEMMSEDEQDIPGIANRDDILRSPDYVPYQAVRRRLGELRELRRDILDDNYSAESGVPPETAPDITEPLQKAISSVLPGVEFEGLEAGEEDSHQQRSTVEMIFRNRSGDRVTFSDLSSGEKDVVAMLFLLVEPEIQQEYVEAGIEDSVDEDLTVLIDGPEIHLHPDLQKRLLNYVQDYLEAEAEDSKKAKFIICTHSKLIMETVPDENLFYLVYPSMAEDNQLEPATDIQTDTLRKITSELGLSALSSGRHLLCVEGERDEEILTHLYPSLDDEFTILSMGGAEQVKNIDTSLSALLEELTSSGREVFAILDRDRNPSLSDDVSDRIHVLNCTCVENIVLAPQAIFSVSSTLLSGRRQEELGIESPERIETMIQEIVSEEEFKEKEIWTRFNESFNPININRREYEEKREAGLVNDFDEFLSNKIEDHRQNAGSIEEIEEEVEEAIEERRWDKLDGKRLLKSLANEFGIEHGRFARVIAREMKTLSDQDSSHDERPPELSEFISNIESRVQ